MPISTSAVSAYLVAGTGVAALLLEALPDAVSGPLAPYERLGLLGAMSAAVVALWRSLQSERKQSREDQRVDRREMVEALDRQATALTSLTTVVTKLSDGIHEARPCLYEEEIKKQNGRHAHS